jgi:hypothetical protein
MLGLPANLTNIFANDAVTTPANNNFFSLGNGGSAVLAFSYALFNGPGSDIQIFETSFYDNSTRTCSNYPEKVKVQGSCDGENFYDLVILAEDAGNGESAGSNVLCRDGKLDLGSLPFVTYIKLTDVTFQGICNFPGIGDGYDVNAVFGLQNCTPLARTDESFISDNAVMEDELLVEIWPNPAKERLNINLLSTLAGDVNLELTDLSGRRVHFESLTQSDVNMIRELSLEQYQPGICFLTISGNDQKVVHKVVKE